MIVYVLCPIINKTDLILGFYLLLKGKEYIAPLGSLKPKHLTMKNNIDFIKIDNGKLGVINLNNMIPVNKNVMIMEDK